MAVREIRPSVHGRYNITAPHSDLTGIFWISHLNFHKKNNIIYFNFKGKSKTKIQTKQKSQKSKAQGKMVSKY